jgi:hypothetical protein
MKNLDLEPNLDSDSSKTYSNPDPDSMKREHPALQKMKFINCFLLFWVIFALLDPDPDPERQSGFSSLLPVYV